MNFYDLLHWIVFQRINGNWYAGSHVSGNLLIIWPGLVVFYKVIMIRDPKRWQWLLVPYWLVVSVLLVACSHEALFSPIWILANVLYGHDLLGNFVTIWNTNLNLWRTEEIAFFLLTGLGLLYFHKEIKFRIKDWAPVFVVLSVWFAIGLPVSLPLPDGSGFYTHDYWVSNGFEFLYNLTFAFGVVRMFNYRLLGFGRREPGGSRKEGSDSERDVH